MIWQRKLRWQRFLMLPTLANIHRGVKLLQFVKPRELSIENRRFSCYPLSVSGKLKSPAELVAIRAAAKSAGKQVVFTNGCFDLLHRGHVQILRGAKSCGEVLIVAINTDRSVRAIKGPSRPVLSETDRAELIGAMEMVDYVVIFDETEPTNLIELLKPDVLVKGGDWGQDKIVGSEIVQKYGGKIAVIPYLQGSSTSEIIERIRG
jgi:rfaE bifunctional protein nucleotidyltransferase chain/domain